MTPVVPLQFRAARSSLIALEACVAVPFGICLAAAVHSPHLWPAVLLCATTGVFLSVWLLSFRLEVQDDQITYRSLLGGRRSLAWHEVATARIEGGAASLADAWKPTFRLIIQPKPGVAAPPLTINLKVFTRSQIRQLLDVLSARVSSADLA